MKADTASSGAMTVPAISIRRLKQTFGGTGGVSIPHLDISMGKTTAILGKSGCGKTTLLHLVSGMQLSEVIEDDTELNIAYFSNGELVSIDTHEADGWSKIRRSIGFVFQDALLIGSASSKANLELSIATASQPKADKKIKELWQDLGIDSERLDLPSRVLSGGMKQRAAIARALLREPSIIFADEPTANLDKRSASFAMDALLRWKNNCPSRTLIIVSHDHSLVTKYADELIVLQKDDEQNAGVLLPTYQWPMINPKEKSAIDELVFDSHDQDRTEPPKSDNNKRISPLCSSPIINPEIKEALSQKLSQQSASRAYAYSVFTRVGMSIMRGTDSPSTSSSNFSPVILGFVEAFLYALGLAVFIIVILNAYRTFFSIEFGTTLAIWLPSTTAILQYPILLTTLVVLVLASFGLILNRTVFKLSLPALLYISTLFVLIIIAIVFVFVQSIISSEFENRMNDPAVQPVLVQSGSSSLFSDELISQIRERFDVSETFKTNYGSDVNVFGRYHKLGVRAYVPNQPQNSDRLQQCSTDHLNYNEISIVAPTREEYFASGLQYSPLDEEFFGTPNEFQDAPPDLANIEFEMVNTSDIGTVFEPPVSEILLSLDRYQFFLENNVNIAPTWLCIDVKFTSKDTSDDLPVRIKGIIKDIPPFDTRKYDAVFGQTGGELLETKGTSINVDYKIAAIWLDKENRQESLSEIDHMVEDGLIKTVPGYTALRKVLQAANFLSIIINSLTTAVFFIVLAVLYLITTQIIETLRREIAVVRAFGCNFVQLLCFVFSAMLMPVVFVAIYTILIAVFIGPTLLTVGGNLIEIETFNISNLLLVSFGVLGTFVGSWIVLTTAITFRVNRLNISAELQETT
ncbi:ABC transporter ATP-binding protein [Lentilitoribacter sp. EG35]|uniref:ABC transporter ATP-binding protein n=1 Tax=Lentilitoribacter sp. EG35 TaxID=3234192 RepID=UPI00345F57CB